MENKGYPVITGGTDERGRTVEKETYDKGSYIETITRVTKGDKVDVYDDKNHK